jgi:hypothetical protein
MLEIVDVEEIITLKAPSKTFFNHQWFDCVRVQNIMHAAAIIEKFRIPNEVEKEGKNSFTSKIQNTQ